LLLFGGSRLGRSRWVTRKRSRAADERINRRNRCAFFQPLRRHFDRNQTVGFTRARPVLFAARAGGLKASFSLELAPHRLYHLASQGGGVGNLCFDRFEPLVSYPGAIGWLAGGFIVMRFGLMAGWLRGGFLVMFTHATVLPSM
jgi:hypothetical protein